MDDLVKNATSISWWLGVVGVGITINLITPFVKKQMDTSISRVSMFWRKRSQKQRDYHQAYIAIMLQDGQEELLAAMKEIGHRLRFFGGIIPPFLLLISVHRSDFVKLDPPWGSLAEIGFLGSLSIMILISFSSWTEASRISRILSEVRERKRNASLSSGVNEVTQK